MAPATDKLRRAALGAAVFVVALGEHAAFGQPAQNPAAPPAESAESATAAPEGATPEPAVDVPATPAEPVPEVATTAPAPTEAAPQTAVPLQPVPAAKPAGSAPDLWSKFSIGTVWYLSGGFGKSSGADFSNVRITRGYLTLKWKPVPWFQPRVTLDTHQDDSGDWKVRLKYMYAKFVLPVETAWVTEPNVELGLVHGPWFDYEENINRYRMQGTMFIERNGVLNSADTGVTVSMLLGKKLPKAYQQSVSKEYPGELGSVAFGVYNGGGYHAAEKNTNKVFESRVSIRPLGPILPNLQLSYLLIYGKGNTPAQVCDDTGANCYPGEPAWRLNAGMASFEHEYFVATAQLAKGRGNQTGSKIDVVGTALTTEGYSGFAEVKLPWIDSSLVGRYDHWEWGGKGTDRVIAGLAYRFLGEGNVVLLDYDRSMPDGGSDSWEAKLTVQVKVP